MAAWGIKAMTMKKISRLLKTERLRLGLTQLQAASIAEVCKRTYAGWEAAFSKIPFDAVVKLSARGFDFSAFLDRQTSLQGLFRETTARRESQEEVISKRLFQQRIKNNLTQQKCSEICSVHIKSYQRWELGKAGMRVSDLAILSRHGFDAQFILTGLESPNAASAGHFSGLSANIEGTLP